MQDFTVTIALSNIDGARLVYDENPYTGVEELGMFLPLQEANILKTEKNYCYMSFYAKALLTPMKKMSHILKPVYNKDNLKKRIAAGSPKIRYAGKLKAVDNQNR